MSTSKLFWSRAKSIHLLTLYGDFSIAVRVEQSDKDCDSQSLKYVPSGPLRKKFADPCSELYSISGKVFLNLGGTTSSGVKGTE